MNKPVSFEQALKEKHSKEAMIDKLKLPYDKKCIDLKWNF